MNIAATVDALFGLFGFARARFSQDADTILSVLESCGAVKCGESGMPTAFTNYYFRVRGQKIKLTVEDYQDTILTGRKAIVQELSQKILERVRPR